MTQRIGFLLMGLVLFVAAGACQNMEDNNMVIFETTLGEIAIELYHEKAPISARNFASYAESGFFDGTIFHRVIPGFVIQGGGFQSGMVKKETNAPIKNEADNGLKNTRGTLSMARTSVVDSATSQFFINVADNVFLDHTDTNEQGYGYAVFGKVIDGMSTVDAIVSQATTSVDGFQDVPTEDIVITKARVQ